jgi:hypothetical protein
MLLPFGYHVMHPTCLIHPYYIALAQAAYKTLFPAVPILLYVASRVVLSSMELVDSLTVPLVLHVDSLLWLPWKWINQSLPSSGGLLLLYYLSFAELRRGS